MDSPAQNTSAQNTSQPTLFLEWGDLPPAVPSSAPLSPSDRLIDAATVSSSALTQESDPPARIVLRPLANQIPMIDLRRLGYLAQGWLAPGGTFQFTLRDPDHYGDEPWPGAPVSTVGAPVEWVRPLRQWVEWLRLFPFYTGMPRPVDGDSTLFQWTVRRERTRAESTDAPEKDVEAKYGTGSRYRQFDRLEEPEATDDLLYAFSRLAPGRATRVLSLGVNDGRELDAVAAVTDQSPELWGIDASESAIEGARVRFPGHRERFFVADLNDLADMDLPQFSVVCALGVLQTTTVDRDRLLRALKGLLTPSARVLFSIPNCHFESYDILRRPLRRDDPRADRSLVSKDVRLLSRWFYRAGFQRVETFGSYDAYVLGLRRSSDPRGRTGGEDPGV